MKPCPLYNSGNLNFTGSAYVNPYSLIQHGGKTKAIRKNKKILKRSNKKRVRGRKTRKYKR